MTFVAVSPEVQGMMQAPAGARNGQVVGAHVENAMRNASNQLLAFRGKELFAYASPIDAIPASGGTRVRWRFHAKTSPNCDRLHVHVLVAAHSGVDAQDPSVYFSETLAGYGTLTWHFGNSIGASDVPSDFAEFSGSLDVAGSTEIACEFGDTTEGRIVAAIVFEEMLPPDTANGFFEETSAGANIYDSHRQALATLIAASWAGCGSQVWNWTTDTAAAAPTNTTVTFKNLLNTAVTTVTAASPGATIDMTGKAVSRQEATGVPVKMWVYASVTSSAGVVKLVDSAGTTMLSVAITGAAAWYSVTGVLPASAGKYDLQCALNAAVGTLTVHAVSIYEDGIS